MRILPASAVLVLLSSAAIAQTAEQQATAQGATYPQLAELARVQGWIRINVNRGVVTLRSGHPLIAPAAMANAKALAPLLDQGEYEIEYRFELTVDPTIASRSEMVKRGDAFDRVILRILGLKTEKVVVTSECVQGARPANEIKISGSAIEIRIQGRIQCPPIDYGLM